MAVKRLLHKKADRACERAAGTWALINEGSSDVIYLDAESPMAALLESLEKLGWGLYLCTGSD